jgi:hypothetical protein
MGGSDKLQIKLREEGGIRALLGMVRSCHPDVLAQVARGIANFAKCESRGAAQGIFSSNMVFYTHADVEEMHASFTHHRVISTPLKLV